MHATTMCTTPRDLPCRQKVRELFQQAAAAGLNVVRTFAHTTDSHAEWVLQVGACKCRQAWQRRGAGCSKVLCCPFAEPRLPTVSAKLECTVSHGQP